MSIPRSNGAEPLSILEIHLDQVRWNYLSLQKRLKKGADCAAVVKADAYGLGAAEVVPELYKENCRHFYVAHFNEGVVVRDALNNTASSPRRRGSGRPSGRHIDSIRRADALPDPRLRGDDSSVDGAQVYVLHGPSGASPEEFSHHGLIPVLSSAGDIEYWAGYAKKTEKKQPAVIQIDTGMNRLGLSAPEVERLKNNHDILKYLDVRYIMSHLACADEPEHPKNKEQLEKFQRLTTQLGLPCRLSFANSAGIFLGADYHFDQARPGCALYGINPQSAGQNPMHGTVSLKLRILQIRDAARGETVGYGASYKVPSPKKLAIISAGYADGLPRSLTDGGMVTVGGAKCPLVGRVSMDLMIADITGAVCSVGDYAEMIGEHQTVDDVAAQAKTIGYEILTSLGRRYTRIYSGRE